MAFSLYRRLHLKTGDLNMRLLSWLRARSHGLSTVRAGQTLRRPPRKPVALRPQVESLEDRLCPSGYGIVDLGAFGGADSEAHAINAAGQVVGRAQTASGANHPFLYSAGVMTDLGLAPGFTDSAATALNDQ